MINKISELYGRQINRSLIDPKLLSARQCKKRPAMVIRGNNIFCQRCGAQSNRREVALPHHQYYCPICMKLGRVSTLEPLISVKEPHRFPKDHHPMTWTGHLTNEQAQCSREIVKGYTLHQSRLLWAVTGAGKTEMLFPGLNWAIQRGLRIGIASPRVDVCIELYPRIKAAFRKTSIVLLHGRSPQKYRYSQITVCTTHQLLRFYHAFDILIVDEVDAFPFVHNQPLHFALKHAVAPINSQLYLTATPNSELLKRVHHHKLEVSYLPLRFHRHLLPVIKCHLVPRWRRHLKKNHLPKLLIQMIQQRLKQQIRFLLFVPQIRDLAAVSKVLKKYFDHRLWRTVYSQDPDRLSKVKLMREHRVQFLVTTTILERGVTFPGIDVFIIGADEDVFSTSSLVQIAGRVGRKRDRPTGNVDYFIRSYTRSIKSAQRQIEHMNYLGAKLL